MREVDEKNISSENLVTILKLLLATCVIKLIQRSDATMHSTHNMHQQSSSSTDFVKVPKQTNLLTSHIQRWLDKTSSYVRH